MSRTTIEAVPATRARLIPRSGNRKTGPIPVSYTSAQTCPDACPLKSNGCYAEGYPVNQHWGARERFDDWLAFCQQVSELPPETLWRHNVAGDLPGVGDALDTVALSLLVEANRGRRGFTYTHKPLSTPHERSAVKRATLAGFTVNLSADSLAEADELAHLGPTVVTLTSDAPQVSRTPAGRTVVACPAEQSETLTCERCRLCSNATRKVIVGFRAHGASFQRVNKRLRVVQ